MRRAPDALLRRATDRLGHRRYSLPQETYGSDMRTFRLVLTKSGFPKAKHTPPLAGNAFNTSAPQLG